MDDSRIFGTWKPFFEQLSKTKSENKDLKKQKDQTPELLQLKNRLKAIEAEVKSKDEEIEDLREQVEIVQNEKEWSIKILALTVSIWP